MRRRARSSLPAQRASPESPSSLSKPMPAILDPHERAGRVVGFDSRGVPPHLGLLVGVVRLVQARHTNVAHSATGRQFAAVGGRKTSIEVGKRVGDGQRDDVLPATDMLGDVDGGVP